jgi:hypothetical protein
MHALLSCMAWDILSTLAGMSLLGSRQSLGFTGEKANRLARHVHETVLSGWIVHPDDSRAIRLTAFVHGLLGPSNSRERCWGKWH